MDLCRITPGSSADNNGAAFATVTRSDAFDSPTAAACYAVGRWTRTETKKDRVNTITKESIMMAGAAVAKNS